MNQDKRGKPDFFTELRCFKTQNIKNNLTKTFFTAKFAKKKELPLKKIAGESLLVFTFLGELGGENWVCEVDSSEILF